MIRVPKVVFHRVAATRGYSLEQVSQCVVSQSGNWLTVDDTHPAYPRSKKAGTLPDPAITAPPAGSRTVKVPASGPGTELKTLLKNWLGITASPNCSCNARAKQMDVWGADECERRIPEIVGWLEQQAKGRGLPFMRFAGEQAVKLAIRRARRKAAQ